MAAAVLHFAVNDYGARPPCAFTATQSLTAVFFAANGTTTTARSDLRNGDGRAVKADGNISAVDADTKQTKEGSHVVAIRD